MTFSPIYSSLAALPLPRVVRSVVDEWTPNESPMSTNAGVAVTLALYLVVIFSGQHFMKNFKAFSQSSAAVPRVLDADRPTPQSCKTSSCSTTSFCPPDPVFCFCAWWRRCAISLFVVAGQS